MNAILILISILPLMVGYAGATNVSPLSVSISADGFVDAALFRSAWSAKPFPEPVCVSYRAGVVNHHALASDLLAGFFYTLHDCEPDLKRFVILSPDHFGQAHASVVTHDEPYSINGHLVKTEALPDTREQAPMFEREHGIGALIPFLQHEFPDAVVIPVVVKASIRATERSQLAEQLKNELKIPGTFVIVSSDMSHYLPEAQALRDDLKTKQVFVGGDIPFFASASDDYTDNGPSIAAALAALGQTKWTLLKESISTRYGGSSGYTTSYLVGLWR